MLKSSYTSLKKGGGKKRNRKAREEMYSLNSLTNVDRCYLREGAQRHAKRRKNGRMYKHVQY